MLRHALTALALATLAAASGCSRNDNAPTSRDGQKLNEATPLASPAPTSPVDPDADNPQTGLNTQRPDSQKDLESSAPR